jgi:hypothetical protein
MGRLTGDGARVVARALALILLVGFLAGCSTYATKSTRFRAVAEGGEVAAALADVRKEAGDDPDVLALLQEGLLAYYVGEYPASVAAFDSAATKIDDQFTKSISKEALAFLSNDQSRPYDGYPGEQALMHIYAALAYLADGNRASALVETRAASTKLERLEQVRENREAYTRDAFAEWMAAMLYAEDDDANACLVSCRRALTAYLEAGEAWGQPLPDAFVDDYVRWADRFGFSDEGREISEKYGERGPGARRLGRGEGEVVLLYESGWVDHLEEARISFPILESDRYSSNDDWATNVYARGPRGVYVAPRNVKIAYWLDVAWPVLSTSQSVLVQARVSVDSLTAMTEPVHDVSSIFRVTFEEGSGTRAIRTIARGLAKYAAVEAIDDDEDTTRQIASFIANIFAAGTEVADTRSWTMLPDRIHIARLRLPEGTHRISVEVLDAQGRIGQRLEFEDVRVVRGSRTILHHRSFR